MPGKFSVRVDERANRHRVMKKYEIEIDRPIPCKAEAKDFVAFWSKYCPQFGKAVGKLKSPADIAGFGARVYDTCKLDERNLGSRADYARSAYPGTFVLGISWSLRKGGLPEPQARTLARACFSVQKNGSGAGRTRPAGRAVVLSYRGGV